VCDGVPGALLGRKHLELLRVAYSEMLYH